MLHWEGCCSYFSVINSNINSGLFLKQNKHSCLMAAELRSGFLTCGPALRTRTRSVMTEVIIHSIICWCKTWKKKGMLFKWLFKRVTNKFDLTRMLLKFPTRSNDASFSPVLALPPGAGPTEASPQVSVSLLVKQSQVLPSIPWDALLHFIGVNVCACDMPLTVWDPHNMPINRCYHPFWSSPPFYIWEN